MGMAAVAVYALGMAVDDAALRMALLGVIAGLGLGAVFSLIDWGIHRLVHYARLAREMETITPELRRLQVLEQMRPEALQLVMWLMPRASVFPGSPGPSLSLALGEVNIPYEFVDQFIEMGDGDWLCSIRTWGEGSSQRDWAMVLTNFFVMSGFAEAARGNRPARWRDKAGALAAIGMEAWSGNELITEEFIERMLERKKGTE